MNQVFFTCVLSVIFLLVPAMVFVRAETAENLQDNLDILKKQIETTKNILKLKNNQATLLDKQIDVLENRSERLKDDVETNKKKLSEVQGNVEALQSRIETNEKRMTVQKSILTSLLRSYYEISLSGDLIENPIQSSGDSALMGSQDSIQSIQQKVAEELENIVTLTKSLDEDKHRIEENRLSLAELVNKLESQTVYLEGAQSQKEALLEQTKTEQKSYEKKLDKLEEERRDIENEIEEIESSKTGSIDLKSMPAPKKGLLGFPVAEPASVSQSYGKATWTKWYSFHNGVDFTGKVGDPIFAAESGKVIATGDSGRYAYGKWVVIDHGNGLATLYGHLSKVLVTTGEAVSEAKKIGLLGNTGYSTGPHVHFTVFSSKSFEVRASSAVRGVKIPTGAHVNPNRYLK